MHGEAPGNCAVECRPPDIVVNLQPTISWRGDRASLFLLEPRHVAEPYVKWLRDPNVIQYLESRFEVHDLSSTIAYVTRMRADPDVLMLGVHSLDLDRHVGNIKLGPINRRHGLGEIGLMIGERDAWGRGIATDAVNVLAQIAAHQLSIRKLTASCYASNVASERVFSKAGFAVEARLKDYYLLDDRPEDLVLMARYVDSASARGALR